MSIELLYVEPGR